MPVKIGDYEVYHNDDVSHGLRYLAGLPEEDRNEMFQHAQGARDHNNHFQARIDGRDLRYVLIHNNDGTYTLRPKP